MATNKNTEAVEETVATTEETTEAVAEPTEKMVKVKLPRDKATNEDKFVSVNMRTWIVKRGEWVEVPACVAEQLEHEEKMMETIQLFNDEKAK